MEILFFHVVCKFIMDGLHLFLLYDDKDVRAEVFSKLARPSPGPNLYFWNPTKFLKTRARPNPKFVKKNPVMVEVDFIPIFKFCTIPTLLCIFFRLFHVIECSSWDCLGSSWDLLSRDTLNYTYLYRKKKISSRNDIRYNWDKIMTINRAGSIFFACSSTQPEFQFLNPNPLEPEKKILKPEPGPVARTSLWWAI